MIELEKLLNTNETKELFGAIKKIYTELRTSEQLKIIRELKRRKYQILGMGSLTKPPFKETSFSKNYYAKEMAEKPTIARNIGRGIDSYSNNWRVTPSFDLGNWHFIEIGKEIRKKRKGQEDKNYCPLIRIYLQSFDISVEGNPHILYDRISLYNFITKAYKVTIFDLPLNKQELNGLMGVIEAFGKEKYTPTPEAEWLKFIEKL